MANLSINVVFGLLSTLTIFLLFGGTQGCISKFNNQEKIAKVDKDCLTKLGLTKTPPTPEQLMKPDFDDKGYGICMLYGLELINDDKHLERDNMLDMIDENAPKGLSGKLTEVASKCADAAKIDKVTAVKDSKVKAETSPFANFYGCFVSGADKLC